MSYELPTLGPRVPRRGNALSRFVGRWALRALGWRVEGRFPDVRKLVAIIAPHTSNWDFVVGIATVIALGLDFKFLGKDTLFRPPLGWFVRFMGGLPVDRKAAAGLVDGVVDAMRRADTLFLAIAPEGTRRRVEKWKTGFHRIARGAEAPIWPVAFDYSRRTVVLLPLFDPTPDADADLRALRALYEPRMARYPENFA
jgi:1-acyl-sn-glycerol-3-phosphate acyltransferase